MSLNIEEIQNKLRTVMYPELGVNIIDLGLVYDIKNLENKIEIEMTLTSVDSPFQEVIKTQIKKALFYSCNNLEIIFTFSPPWSSIYITPEGKKHLKTIGYAF
jgi:metal-sulfur cluster biosynthetic enzyme